MTYPVLVLARKWRPHNFQSFVGQQHVIRALSNALNQNRLHHAYLLTGTRGVGKTTLARILAKCLNCEVGISADPCEKCSTCLDINAGRFVDLMEIDAASRTKVEDTRELLDNIMYAPTRGRFKVYLIDEVHMLSNHSFNALLKTLEEPPEHVKFLLATTDPHKLPATIRSRCLQFHLKNMSIDQIVSQLQHILTQEKIGFEANALPHLARAANGSMRDALSLLDQAIAYGDNTVNENEVRAMLGLIEEDYLYLLLEALQAKDAKAIVDHIHQMIEANCDFNQALEDLLSLLHHLTLIKMISLDEKSDRIKKLAQQMTLEDLQLCYQFALIGRRDLALAPSFQSGFEMTMLRMLAFQLEAPTTQATQTTQTTKTAAAPITDEWTLLMSKLSLNGPNRILASHCTLKSLTSDAIELQLDPEGTPLLNPLQKESLQKAINDYFKKPMKLTILIETAENLTPAKAIKQEKIKRHEAAVQTIQNDPQVQTLLDTFSAKIEPDKVEPID